MYDVTIDSFTECHKYLGIFWYQTHNCTHRIVRMLKENFQELSEDGSS